MSRILVEEMKPSSDKIFKLNIRIHVLILIFILNFFIWKYSPHLEFNPIYFCIEVMSHLKARINPGVLDRLMILVARVCSCLSVY